MIILNHILKIWSSLGSTTNQVCFQLIRFNILKQWVLENDMKVFLADITKIEADAIVNAANSSLLGGGGVDGAIHKSAGSELLDECRKLNGCEIGQSKITSGYNLPAKCVIHTVGPIWNKTENSEVLLSNCYLSSLELAKTHDLKSIVFPCISTGVYEFPNDLACRIAISTCRKFLKNNDYKIEIIFCCFLKKDYDLYENYLNRSAEYYYVHSFEFEDQTYYKVVNCMDDCTCDCDTEDNAQLIADALNEYISNFSSIPLIGFVNQ